MVLRSGSSPRARIARSDATTSYIGAGIIPGQGGAPPGFSYLVDSRSIRLTDAQNNPILVKVA